MLSLSTLAAISLLATAEQSHQNTHRAFVARVLAQHPSVEAAKAALGAAKAKVPQAFSWQDPMLSVGVAPGSLSGQVPFGQEIRLSQKLPAFGLFSRESKMAENDVSSAEAMLLSTQQSLALSAWQLLLDEDVLRASLSVNEQHQELMEEFRASAQAQYAAGTATSQDVLLAEVEWAMLEEEKVMLLTDRKKVIAGLNGLLGQTATTPLPDFGRLPSAPGFATVQELEGQAFSQRPELRALSAQLSQSAFRLSSARASYVPEFDLMASYNSMWEMPQHRLMVGLGVNLPVPWARRGAAVNEATENQRQLKAQLETLQNEIRVEVASRHAEWVQATSLVKLYEDRLLPASRDRLNAARSGFIAGKNTFQSLIEAERAVRNAELRLFRTKAEVLRRAVQLDLSLGQMPGESIP